MLVSLKAFKNNFMEIFGGGGLFKDSSPGIYSKNIVEGTCLVQQLYGDRGAVWGTGASFPFGENVPS